MKVLTYNENGNQEMKNVQNGLITGQIASLFMHYPGSKTLDQMQKSGWARMDGTTIESQLVASGYFALSELAITGTTYSAWSSSYPPTEPVGFVYCL